MPSNLVAVVDAGPKIITFIVAGRLQDGGAERQFGWGRFSAQLRGLNGADTLELAGGYPGQDRARGCTVGALRTSGGGG